MARLRISRLAQADLARVLALSTANWGAERRLRYSALIANALRTIAERPDGPLSVERPELGPGIRSFHVRHARLRRREANVRRAVHIIYYRASAPELIEIVRVLHERMDPAPHLSHRRPHDN